MRLYWQSFLLCAPFLLLAFLSVPFGQRPAAVMSGALPLDHWDMGQLVEHLNGAGMELRMVPIAKDGPLDQTVFLTSTKQDWSYCNSLVKDPTHIHRWRGIVQCLLTTPSAGADWLRQWGDQGLLIGPFAFYGDPELLSRISAALNDPAPTEAP